MTGRAPIAIVDYGMGNLRSVQKAFEHIGHPALVTGDPEAVADAERVVVPGVGAFGDCLANLARKGLDEALRQVVSAGRPYLGICLGLQALFTTSEEFGPNDGLNLVPGRVVRFPEGELKVPHIGWNSIETTRPHPVLEGIPDGTHFYFAHSYFVKPSDPEATLATTEHGGGFTSAVARGSVVALQFHPEKSQRAGLAVLANFAAWSGGA
jgi:glutamine amidotransferase